MGTEPNDRETIKSIEALLPHFQAIEQACQGDPTRQLATFAVFLFGALDRHANHYDTLPDLKAKKTGMEAFKYLAAGLNEMVQVAMQEWPVSPEQAKQADKLVVKLIDGVSWIFGAKFISKDELEDPTEHASTLPH